MIEQWMINSTALGINLAVILMFRAESEHKWKWLYSEMKERNQHLESEMRFLNTRISTLEMKDKYK